MYTGSDVVEIWLGVLLVRLPPGLAVLAVAAAVAAPVVAWPVS